MHFETIASYIHNMYILPHVYSITTNTGIYSKFKTKVCACVSGCVTSTAVATTTRILQLVVMYIYIYSWF